MEVEIKPVQVQSYCRVNRRTVGDWMTKGLPMSIAAGIEYWRSTALAQNRTPMDSRPTSEGGDGAPTMQQKRLTADTQKILEDVRLKQLRYQERIGELVQREEVVREVAEFAVRIKERLLAAPDEFETRFPAEVRQQCKADFTEFVRQLLLELSTWRIQGTACDDIVVQAAEKIVESRVPNPPPNDSAVSD